ncbi:MAG: inositol monophosphatase [Patescibacteria group bacterium]
MTSLYLKTATSIALKAGDIMLGYFTQGVDSTIKSDKSIVTKADLEINRLLIETINQEFPDHAICAEEESDMRASDYIWVCDPLDGTNVFSKGLPISVFSLALTHKGESIVAVVYDPFTKRLYTAEKGKGAYMNNKKIEVNSNPLGYQSTVDVEWLSDAKYDLDSVRRKLALETSAFIIQIGTTVNAGCLVAAGQFEAMLFAGSKGKNVDIAALKLLVEEAGGKVTNLFGENERYDQNKIKGAIVSNGVVHEQIVKVCKEILK